MRKRLLLFFIFFAVITSVSLFFNFRFQAVANNLIFDEQEATIRAIKKINPAVVSIAVNEQQEVISVDLLTGKQTVSKTKKTRGSGSGFLITADGLILTNKHVVNAANEDSAEYRIILSTGKQYFAQLIGKDPINDLAVLKIFDKNLPYVELGDSDKLQLGHSVMAIGNALGRYQNSVTKGIVSGMGRSIEASDQAGRVQALDNAIQTDAEINLGNSGGPLIDLNGNVVGINVAIDQSGSAIGFAIPINDARPVIKSVREVGRIIRPRVGVRYLMLTPEIAQEKIINRASGALIIRSTSGSPAILPGSPADKAGLQENDIVFEINAIKIDGPNTLLSVTQRFKPGDKLGFKIQRGDKIIIATVVLDEFK